MKSCELLLSCGLALVFACEPATLSENGVLAVFGSKGVKSSQFNYPRAIAAEIGGSVFVVDKSGRVQRFSPHGQFETEWRLEDTTRGYPVGLAVHPDGRIFVADTHNHRVLVFNRDGQVLTSFGSEGTGEGEFQLPTDVAFDSRGFLYVAEYHLNDRITKWSPEFQFVSIFGDQEIDGRRLSRPSGVAVDADDTLWVADSCNHRLVRFDPQGRVLATFGEFGSEPGQLRYPYDVAISPDQTILVCEYEGARLQWFSKDGRSLRTWGRHGRAVGELFAPWGATYGAKGQVFVVDSLNSRVQILQP
ncbi:MAG: 6-bladed beta-propeller [Planctomycetota bacterium]